MRRIGVGKVQNHPWRPGDFAEMVILKNEAESGFRRPGKKRRLFRYTALSQIFMFNVQVSGYRSPDISPR